MSKTHTFPEGPRGTTWFEWEDAKFVWCACRVQDHRQLPGDWRLPRLQPFEKNLHRHGVIWLWPTGKISSLGMSSHSSSTIVTDEWGFVDCLKGATSPPSPPSTRLVWSISTEFLQNGKCYGKSSTKNPERPHSGNAFEWCLIRYKLELSRTPTFWIYHHNPIEI